MPISLTLHRPAEVPDELMASLTGCHERIRRFSRLAITLATADAAPLAERAEAAAAVVRYFTLALPLHAADEDLSLTPRLRGRDPAVDAALARMTADHLDHGPALAKVVAACRRLVAEPAALGEVGPGLGVDAGALCAAFDDHLALEEAVIFPAIATLTAAEVAAIRDELIGRRR